MGLSDSPSVCLSVCLIQQQDKGAAALVCTLETLKALCGDFLWFEGEGEHGER